MSERFKKICKEWIVPLLPILIVFLVARALVLFVYVPTGSMIPTIDERSILFALRVYTPEKNLERGDIVVFDSDELGIRMVKRLIGLPGDSVVLEDDGTAFINGQRLEEPYIRNRSRQGGEFQVPEGCYFFLGDNRSGSLDARFWSNPYIPAERIVGKAVFTLWPFQDLGVLR